MENTAILETERLRLRKFEERDLQALFVIYHDSEVNTFLPWYPLQTKEEAYSFWQEHYVKEYEKERSYMYAVCLKEDDVPIGYLHVGMDDAHDFGYGLRKMFWGMGIMTEAGKALIARLKEDGVPYITATHDVNNKRSGKVMKRLGMKYQYSYEELWQPKNKKVVFRMYQLHLDAHHKEVYRYYWDAYAVHFIEENID